MAAPAVSRHDKRLYSTLPTARSIRLLRLLPSQDSGVVHCSLTIVEDLDQAPPYEALSYVWGPPDPKETIVCNSVPKQVTSNLAGFLRQLRACQGRTSDTNPSLWIQRHVRPENDVALPAFARRMTLDAWTRLKASYLWIDAICINQDDIQERSAQVAIMRDVYGKARLVAVWLQGDHRQLPTALSLFNIAWKNYCRERPVEESVDADYIPSLDMVKRDNNLAWGFPDIDDPAWHCMNRFIQNPWFTRLWVVQEAAMASECVMLCGDIELQWNVIGRAALWLERKGYSYVSHNPDGRNLSHISLIWQLRECRTNEQRNLSRLLEDSRGFSATLRHDKIYALLGLAAPSPLGYVRWPDYSKSENEVFMETTKSIIEEEQSLRVLTAVRHGDRAPLTGPSWIPDWKWEDNAGAMLSAGDVNRVFRASSERKVDMHRGNLNVLSLGGIFVGDVAVRSHAVVQCDQFLSQQSPVLRAWKELKCAGIKFEKHNGSSQSLEQIFTVTVTAGLDFSRRRAGVGGQYWLDASTYWHTLGASDLEFACSKTAAEFIEPSTSTSEGDLASFSHAVSFSCDGRCLFVTKDGSLGVGPRAMELGDYVVVLYGACVPYILRTSGAAYRLIGECYVKDLMNGEAVAQAQLKNLPSQTFDLV